jgi:opine dehydrogenase
LNEDVGYGLVFISDLGKEYGVETRLIDAVILLASSIMGTDYRTKNPFRFEKIQSDVQRILRLN